VASAEVVLGVDLGTGACKVDLLQPDGECIEGPAQHYPSSRPHPQWVEQDPDDWARAATRGVRKALDLAGNPPVAAMAVTAPHHVAVLLDRAGRPLRPAIMWNDQRSGRESRALENRAGAVVHQRTANAVSPTWTLPQLAWLREHQPEVLDAVHRVLFMKDWVRHRMTGDTATDHIDAAGSLLFDVQTGVWDADLLGLVGLAPDVMPEVRAPTALGGTVSMLAASEMGLRPGTPVVVGTADTAAEILAAGAVTAGDRVVKLATAGNVTVVTDELAWQEGLITYRHLVDGLAYANAATSSGAAAVRWFREALGAAGPPWDSVSFADIDRWAAGAPDGAGGVLFLPHLDGQRAPAWDSELRGAFVGLTARHDVGHLARAVMEGVAYSLRDAGRLHARAEGATRPTTLIGGGARSVVWPQVISDVLGEPLRIPDVGDAALGACLLAACAAGWFADPVDAARSRSGPDRIVDPHLDRAEGHRQAFEVYLDAGRALTSVSHALGRLERSRPTVHSAAQGGPAFGDAKPAINR
jgi:xylulokinase